MNDSLVLDGRVFVVLAILAVYLGKFANAKVAFLRTYQIPDPVPMTSNGIGYNRKYRVVQRSVLRTVGWFQSIMVLGS